MTTRRISSTADVKLALAWLKRHGTQTARTAMARYNIPSDHAFGVPMNQVQRLAKQIGRSHETAAVPLGQRLVRSAAPCGLCRRPCGWSRRLRWIVGAETSTTGPCATPVCFVLFDRTPHAWGKVEQWARRRDEFGKRAAFALLWGLTVHDKSAGDEPFVRGLRLVERAASDERHLRRQGGEHGAACHREAQPGTERRGVDGGSTADCLRGRSRTDSGEGRRQRAHRASQSFGASSTPRPRC